VDYAGWDSDYNSWVKQGQGRVAQRKKPLFDPIHKKFNTAKAAAAKKFPKSASAAKLARRTGGKATRFAGKALGLAGSAASKAFYPLLGVSMAADVYKQLRTPAQPRHDYPQY
jgi:hypothetical protein